MVARQWLLSAVLVLDQPLCLGDMLWSACLGEVTSPWLGRHGDFDGQAPLGDTGAMRALPCRPPISATGLGTLLAHLPAVREERA